MKLNFSLPHQSIYKDKDVDQVNTGTGLSAFTFSVVVILPAAIRLKHNNFCLPDVVA